MGNNTIEVELTYANVQQQYLMPLRVAQGCSVRQLIDQSGIIEQFPEIDLNVNKVGIFAKQVALDTPLRGGERVEIYRPLLIEPKQRRRLLAQAADKGTVAS